MVDTIGNNLKQMQVRFLERKGDNMNTYIFKLDDGTNIEISAPTRIIAMEMFEEMYFDKKNNIWLVNLVNISVEGY